MAAAGVAAAGVSVAPATATVAAAGVSVATGTAVAAALLHAATSAAMTIEPARSRLMEFMFILTLIADPSGPGAPPGGPDLRGHRFRKLARRLIETPSAWVPKPVGLRSDETPDSGPFSA